MKKSLGEKIGAAAFLSCGFRPFFWGATVWAVVSMGLWIAMLAGWVFLPTDFDPLSWHTHEFIFGYTGAVIAGFLLTAVPNWTGRLPLAGLPLAGVFGLWLVGRGAVAFSVFFDPFFVALLALSMPLALIFFLGREILSGRNWRNLPVLAVLTVLTGAQGFFHWGWGEQGLRLAVAAIVMLIAVIGGRIVPSFTRNWLKKNGGESFPVPFGGFDKFSLIVLVAVLGLWSFAPDLPNLTEWAGWGLLVAGGLHLIRWGRWRGFLTLSEPLVWVLHLGYLALPLGAVLMAGNLLWGGPVSLIAAQHLWMVGGIGVMTLAIMTRATLGHTGHSLAAGWGTAVLYLSVFASALFRLWADGDPGFLMLSGLCWMFGFGGFVASYGPKLVRPRRT